MVTTVRTEQDKHRIVDALLDAYRVGAFPMADPDEGTLELYTAEHRSIFPLEPGRFHVPRRLKQRLNTAPFMITSDTRFNEVVDRCAKPRSDDNGVWISDELAELYTLLHETGHAHSVEACTTDPGTGQTTLAGGIFGIHIGSAFLGESMFHADPPLGTDASKACLVYLVAHLKARGFTLFDTQLTNPFLERFGNTEIEQAEYESRLISALETEVLWKPFNPDWRCAL